MYRMCASKDKNQHNHREAETCLHRLTNPHGIHVTDTWFFQNIHKETLRQCSHCKIYGMAYDLIAAECDLISFNTSHVDGQLEANMQHLCMPIPTKV